MEVYIVKGAQLLLSLSLLIVLHEFGHFLPARWFGIRVEKFFLFFDVKFALFKKKIGDTVWGIGWLPLGGYVKIAGMIDESMDTEAMKEAPKEWEFRSKPAWQRLIVMIGGVTVNIILGFLIYILIIMFYGKPYTTPDDMKYGFAVTKTMENYGFEQGDKILEVNGEPFFNQLAIGTYLMMRDVDTVKVLHETGEQEVLTVPEDIGKELFASGDMFGLTQDRYPIRLDSIAPQGASAKAGLQLTDSILTIKGKPIRFRSDLNYIAKNTESLTVPMTVLRDGEEVTLQIERDEDRNFGVYTSPTDRDYIAKQNIQKYGFVEGIGVGLTYGYNKLHDYVVQFKYVFTKKGATQVGGFGAIAGLFPDTWDWIEFWHTTAFISIILAFMNILPIPALDGGHVMFLLYEMITGREPHQKVLEYAQIIGFFLILALVLFANGNDIYRAIFG